MSPIYLDFELEIGASEGLDYPLVVLRSPAGEARATMRLPLSQLQLENRLKDLQIALLTAVQWPPPVIVASRAGGAEFWR
jgi:hypothetical protein